MSLCHFLGNDSFSFSILFTQSCDHAARIHPLTHQICICYALDATCGHWVSTRKHVGLPSRSPEPSGRRSPGTSCRLQNSVGASEQNLNAWGDHWPGRQEGVCAGLEARELFEEDKFCVARHWRVGERGSWGDTESNEWRCGQAG